MSRKLSLISASAAPALLGGLCLGMVALAMPAAAAPTQTTATVSATRDASFIQPTVGGNNGPVVPVSSDALVPVKPDEDVGESILEVSKRVTVFFSNVGGKVLQISNVNVASDGNVVARVDQNDCATVGVMAPGVRCAVGLEITPKMPGPWTAEIVVTHNGLGRVARATVSGQTAGEVKGGQDAPGLSLVTNSKDQIIDFGDVESGVGRAVRSVLLVNDSAQKMDVQQIELVGADRNLNILREGCEVDASIAPGASCPITVTWQPSGRGNVSTDLIIRHSGPVGFAVIPVRGKVAGADGGNGGGGGGGGSGGTNPAPIVNSGPSVNSVMQEAGGDAPAVESQLMLIGTVGHKAILSDANGHVVVAGEGDSVTADGVSHKVLAVRGDRAVVDVDGTPVELTLTRSVQSSGNNKGGNKPPPTTGKKKDS